jgi:hypothetical protein
MRTRRGVREPEFCSRDLRGEFYTVSVRLVVNQLLTGFGSSGVHPAAERGGALGRGAVCE